MTAFPPLHRFWPVYTVVTAIVAGLSYLLHDLNQIPTDGSIDAQWRTTKVLLGGVAVAALAIIANAWSQWRTSSVSHAIEMVQSLRTNREYLLNSSVIKRRLDSLGNGLNEEQSRAFHDEMSKSSVDDPSFRDASIFVLNQYEFLAAGARSGAVDLHVLDKTVRGVTISIVKTYSQQIAEIRKRNPKTFENLVWLYRKFSKDSQLQLGPRQSVWWENVLGRS